MKLETDFDPKGKKILVVSAHADDADFYAGGTLLSWFSSGAKGALVVATNGDKGTSEPNLTSEEIARIRREEQLAASSHLGLKETWFLDFPDGFLENNLELKEKLVEIIRTWKPDAILTFDPSVVYSFKGEAVTHPDHQAIGQATMNAVYPLSRDRLTFPDLDLEPHKVNDLFLYNSDNPNFVVDITNTIEKKIELIEKHASQIKNNENEEWVRSWNSQNGQEIGAKYAESFVHLELP